MAHEWLSRIGMVESGPIGWPVAYADEGELLCEDCMEEAIAHYNATCHPHQRMPLDSEELGAVFSDSEWNSPATCGHCGILFDTYLTPDGERYVKDFAAEVKSGTRPKMCRDSDQEILAAYEQVWSYLFQEDEEEDEEAPRYLPQSAK